MVNIITIEEPQYRQVLTEPAQPVNFPLVQKIKACIADLIEVNKKSQGVGLAAPQINQHLRIFVININKEAAEIRENAESFPTTVYINPEYKPLEDTVTSIDFEGCFSVESLCGWVPRYNEIVFHAYDEQGQKVEFVAKGFLARTLQHETDHVNGKLITDLLTEGCVKGPYEDMLKLRRDSLSSEKREIYDSFIKRQDNEIYDSIKREFEESKPEPSSNTLL